MATAINFPINPTIGDTYTYGSAIYKWDGERWFIFTESNYDSLWDARLATKDTGNLEEGFNLYYTEARVSANTDVAANTEKVSFDPTSSTRLANTSGTNTGDQDLSGYALDNSVVHLSGNETIADVKTFSSFPVTPSSAPTTDYEVANKKFADPTKDVKDNLPEEEEDKSWNENETLRRGVDTEEKVMKTIENIDLNSDITKHRYPNSHPENQENRGNMKLDE